MVTNLDKASKNIAANLSSLRKKKGFSQKQLADLAGMTRAAIALLESGSSNPGLDLLLKLSGCLKVSIEELISAPRAECIHISASDIPLDRRSRKGVILRKLLPEKIPATEMDELTLSPNAILTGSPHIEGTREYFTCIKGQIKVAVMGQVYTLYKGDVLTFPGDKPHSYKNDSTTTAQGISVVFFSGSY